MESREKYEKHLTDGKNKVSFQGQKCTQWTTRRHPKKHNFSQRLDADDSNVLPVFSTRWVLFQTDAIIFPHNRVNESFSSWCLAALLVAWGYPRPPVFDGAGVPWVLTGTHQRDTPSRQDDGASERQPICGWCCHGRRLFTCNFHHKRSKQKICFPPGPIPRVAIV